MVEKSRFPSNSFSCLIFVSAWLPWWPVPMLGMKCTVMPSWLIIPFSSTNQLPWPAIFTMAASLSLIIFTGTPTFAAVVLNPEQRSKVSLVLIIVMLTPPVKAQTVTRMWNLISVASLALVFTFALQAFVLKPVAKST